MMADRPLGIFVVDDHELVRNGLRDAVQAEPDMTWLGEAGTAAEAAVAIAEMKPDVAVLDIRLPDGDGIQLCRHVQAENPSTRCVMLTSFGGEESVHDAILAGAAGYLLKGMRVRDLIAAIRKVAAGQSLLDPAITHTVLERLRDRERPAAGPPLTEQEEQILEAIIEGCSNREIAERMHLAEQTVKNYVSALLSKLGVTSRTQAAVYGATRQAQGSPKRRT